VTKQEKEGSNGCTTNTAVTIGDRPLPVAAAKTWNNLPSDVTSSKTLQVSKSNVKTFFS